MSYEHERYEYKGHTVRIMSDDDPMNPLEDWDHIARLVSRANEYRSWESMREIDADVEALYDTDGEPSVQDLIRYFKEELGARVVLRVYKFEHSGVAFRCESEGGGSPFSCGRDSGMYGFVFDTPERIKAAWSDHVPDDEQIEAALRGIIESYSQYAAGEVYGYIVEDADGEEIDALWGMFGDDDYVKTEAQSAVDHHIAWLAKEDAKVARCCAL